MPRAVDAIVERILRARPEVECGVIFGSEATGRARTGSDVDVYLRREAGGPGTSRSSRGRRAVCSSPTAIGRSDSSRAAPSASPRGWLTGFLPENELAPVACPDPADGKLSHLHDLNLSRALRLESIAGAHWLATFATLLLTRFEGR